MCPEPLDFLRGSYSCFGESSDVRHQGVVANLIAADAIKQRLVALRNGAR
jgi:hypothetical protein